MVFQDEQGAIEELVKAEILSRQELEDIRDIGLIQDAVDGHYDIEVKETGALADRGKVKLKRVPIHGQSNSTQTIDALLMAADAERNGPLVTPREATPHSKELRMAGERLLAPAGASELAGVGLRAGAVEQLDAVERLARALDRIDELDRGFNQVTGSLYDGVALDGGHRVPHSLHGGQSAARENMMFENQYENRVKGNREGEAVVAAMHNSLARRLRAGTLEPLELVNRYQPDSVEIAIDTDGGPVLFKDSLVKGKIRR